MCAPDFQAQDAIYQIGVDEQREDREAKGERGDEVEATALHDEEALDDEGDVEQVDDDGEANLKDEKSDTHDHFRNNKTVEGRGYKQSIADRAVRTRKEGSNTQLNNNTTRDC